MFRKLFLVFSVFYFSNYGQVSPGGVTGSKFWIKTDYSKDGDYFYWKDEGPENTKITDLYNKEHTSNKDDVRYVNFHPSMNVSQSKYYQNLLDSTNFNQASAIGVYVPSLNFTQNTLLYRVDGRKKEGFLVDTDVVLSSKSSKEKPFDYGEDKGKDLRYKSGEDLEKNIEDYQSRSARILTYQRYIQPNTSVWGEPEKSSVIFGNYLEGNKNFTSEFSKEDISSFKFSGFIPEMVFYDRILNPLDRRKVETYLAIKYGITLDKSYVNGNGDVIWDLKEDKLFNNRIAGIINDKYSGLFQPKATTSYDEFYPAYAENSFDEIPKDSFSSIYNTKASRYRLLTLGQSRFSEILSKDNSYLLYGDNNKPLSTESRLDGELHIMNRVWKVRTNINPNNVYSNRKKDSLWGEQNSDWKYNVIGNHPSGIPELRDKYPFILYNYGSGYPNVGFDSEYGFFSLYGYKNFFIREYAEFEGVDYYSPLVKILSRTGIYSDFRVFGSKHKYKYEYNYMYKRAYDYSRMVQLVVSNYPLYDNDKGEIGFTYSEKKGEYSVMYRKSDQVTRKVEGKLMILKEYYLGGYRDGYMSDLDYEEDYKIYDYGVKIEKGGVLYAIKNVQQGDDEAKKQVVKERLGRFRLKEGTEIKLIKRKGKVIVFIDGKPLEKEIVIEGYSDDDLYFSALKIKSLDADVATISNFYMEGFSPYEGMNLELSYRDENAKEFNPEFLSKKGFQNVFLIVDPSGEGDFSNLEDLIIVPYDLDDKKRQKLLFNNFVFDADGSGSDAFTFGYFNYEFNFNYFIQAGVCRPSSSVGTHWEWGCSPSVMFSVKGVWPFSVTLENLTTGEINKDFRIKLIGGDKYSGQIYPFGYEYGDRYKLTIVDSVNNKTERIVDFYRRDEDEEVDFSFKLHPYSVLFPSLKDFIDLSKYPEDYKEFYPSSGSSSNPIEGVVDSEESFIKVYPNPIQRGEDFSLKFHLVDIIRVLMYDFNGVLLYEESYEKGISPIIDLSLNLSGAYLVKVITASGKVYTKKIIVE